MASSVDLTSHQTHESVKKIVALWTSHTDGVVTAATISDEVVNGEILGVALITNATVASDGHDVTIYSEDGVALHTAFDVATAAVNYYRVPIGFDGTNYANRVAVSGKIKIGVVGAGSGKKGTVAIYYR